MKVQLDPRVLFAVQFLMSIAVFLAPAVWARMSLTILALGIMFVSGLKSEALKWAMVYGLLVSAEHFVLNQWLKGALGLLLYLVTNMFPMFIMAVVLVKTVSAGSLLSALSKMKVPKGIVLALSVAFRYVPTLIYEIRCIREARQMRGLKPSLMEKMEWTMVPIMFRSLKLADELTASALTRGIDREGQRTEYLQLKMQGCDYGVLGVTIGVIGLAFVI